MQTEPVIRASRLCKSFLSDTPGRALAKRILGRSPQRVEVLGDIEFEVARGECFGIMGPNGSGKSTLMRLITRAFRPSSGKLEVAGRVLLMNLGTTFNPDLTGRENLVVTGLATGLGQRELLERLPEILAFSELGEAVDHPFRTYSTGMRLRLGFSLFINIEPDILLIDEAFAVGDARFIMKCVEKLRELKRCGTTIVFVSHDGNAIREICDRGMVLHCGRMHWAGHPMEVVEAYHAALGLTRNIPAVDIPSGEVQCSPVPPEEGVRVDEFVRDAIIPRREDRMHSGIVEVVAAKIYRNGKPSDGVLMHGDMCTIQWIIRANKSQTAITSGVHLYSELGAYVFGTSYAHLGTPFDVEAGKYYLLGISVQLLLGPGRYLLSIGIAKPDMQSHCVDGVLFDRVVSIAELQIMQFELGHLEPIPFLGMVQLPAQAFPPRLLLSD